MVMPSLDVTVIVGTYNSDYTKLFQTLYSILLQKDIAFEIIVSDDGSREFDERAIEKFFAKFNFQEYYLIANKENQGTVCNCYGAAKKAKGKYIKFISPGDYIYEPTTLKKAVDFLHAGSHKICFGRTVYYRKAEETSDDYELSNQMAPHNLTPYIMGDYEKIKESYLFHRDYALGAAFVCQRELLIKYLTKISGRVKYAEDCSYIMMIADDVKVVFWDDFIVWYEFGTGISTSGCQKWLEKIWADNMAAFSLIKEEHPELTDICNYHIKNKNLRYFFTKIKIKLNKYKHRLSQQVYKNKAELINQGLLENILAFKYRN